MGDGDDVGDEDAPSPESPDPEEASTNDTPEDATTEDGDTTEESAGSDDSPAGSDDHPAGSDDPPATDPQREDGSGDQADPDAPRDTTDPPFGDADEIAFGGGGAGPDSGGRDDQDPEAGDGRPESGSPDRDDDWLDHDIEPDLGPPPSAEPVADPEAAADAGSTDDDADAADPVESAEGGVKPLIEDESDVHYEPDDPTQGDPETIEPEDLHGPPVSEDAGTATEFEGSTPPDDQEMPLADHIDEMIKRLSIVVGVILVITLGIFPFAEQPILYIWNNVLPPSELTAPRVYGPLELKLTELKVSMLVGFVIALPVFVYQTYLFMRPGLYPRERRYYLAAVPTSLVLAFIGLAFGYFLILPALFSYFLTYSQNAGQIAFALKQTFDLILMLEGYLALVFQIPLFIMLAIMMGLTTRDWLASRRIYFWGGFLGVSYLFGLDPTGVAPIMVAATMVVLFEGTLFLLKWTQRGD